MKRTLAKLLISATSLVLCLLAVEVLVRFMVQRDPDGDLVYRYIRLKPFHAPVEKAKALLDIYAKDKSKALMIYDPDLGWRPTPAGSDGNTGGFASVHLNPPLTPPPGTVRIELFGGSYTRGGAGEAWWKVLDQKLNEKGLHAEVLNFGVGGFSMDQSLLRWRKEGAAYHPDIVIFGFSAGNIMDNVNILRLLQNPDTGIPFTKPRFILDNESLKLVNSPTVPTDQLLAHIADMSHWPVLRYDDYYDPADYAPRWWQASRLVTFFQAKKAAALRETEERRLYQLDREPGQLTLKIIQDFQADVEGHGAKFLVLHLPAAPDLEDYRASGKFCYDQLYQALRQSTTIVPTEQGLMQTISGGDIRSFFDYGHYGSRIQVATGNIVADYLAAHWSSLAGTPGSAK